MAPEPVRVLTPESGVYLRDQSGNTRLVSRLHASTEYRVGRIKVPGSVLVGGQYGMTLMEDPETGTWQRVQPTQIGDEEASGSGVDEAAAPVPLASLSSALSSATFSEKTKFSQEKYLRKKHGKYGKEVTLLQPTVRLLCEGGNLRWDYLALIARFASVSSSSTCLVYETDTSGLVAAHFQVLGAKTIYRLAGVRGSNSAKAAEALFPKEKRVSEPEGGKPLKLQAVKLCQAVKLGEAAAATEQLPTVDVFAAVDAGNPEAPESEEFAQAVNLGLEKLTTTGGRFVAFVKDFDRARDLQRRLRVGSNPAAARFIHVSMQELFLREQQVLDQRTHPVMTAVLKVVDGFVLAAIKVQHRL